MHSFLIKSVKSIFVCMISLLILVACHNKIAQNPKIAVKQGFEQLLNDSFDYEITMTASKGTPDDQSSRRWGRSSGYDSEFLTVYYRFLEQSKVSVTGRYEKEANKIAGQAASKISSDNIDLTIKVPFYMQLNTSDAVFGLYDFNWLLRSRSERINSAEKKATRIKLNSFKQQLIQLQTGMQTTFETLDSALFNKVELDKVDNELDGKEKIRLVLTKTDIEKLVEEKKLPSFLLETLAQAGSANIDFTIGSKGQLVRIHYALYNLLLDSRMAFETVNTDVWFKKAGSVTVTFVPEEKDIVDFTDANGVVFGSEHYERNQLLTRAYGEVSSIKTAVEAALFEGKVPVVTQEEMAQNPGITEWVGWTKSTLISDLTIQHYTDNNGHKDVVATLDGVLKGGQLVLTRSGEGRWSCLYYSGIQQLQTDKKEKIIGSCELMPNSYQPDAVAGAINGSAVTEENIIKMQLSSIYDELQRNKNRVDSALRRTAVMNSRAQAELESQKRAGESGLASIKNNLQMNTRSKLVSGLEIHESGSPGVVRIAATIGAQANEKLHGGKLVLSRTAGGEWTCQFHSPNHAQLSAMVPVGCTIQ